MLGGPGVGLASAGTGPVDEEALQPDRNYTYEMTFSNPLDDAMTVRVFVARPQPPRSEASLTSPSIEQTSGSATKPARAKGWQVSTSTSAFPIHPYNEVWELDEDDADLLGEGSKSEHGRGSGSAGAAAENAGDDVGGGGSGDSAQSGSDDDGQDYKRSRTTGGARRKRRGDGIIRRKGHRTTIGLDLALSREVHGDIEVSLTGNDSCCVV